MATLWLSVSRETDLHRCGIATAEEVEAVCKAVYRTETGFRARIRYTNRDGNRVSHPFTHETLLQIDSAGAIVRTHSGRIRWVSVLAPVTDYIAPTHLPPGTYGILAADLLELRKDERGRVYPAPKPNHQNWPQIT